MDSFVCLDSHSLNDISILLVDIIARIQNVETMVVANVEQFIQNLNIKSSTAIGDLFTYIIAMILYLWQYQHFALESILAGLQEQSLTSLHAYFCPDVKRGLDQKTENSNETDSSNLLDPYKDVTIQLQQLSTMKPRVCSSCRKESIFAFVNAQLRSADEGMTTFVMCGHCGVRHKM